MPVQNRKNQALDQDLRAAEAVARLRDALREQGTGATTTIRVDDEAIEMPRAAVELLRKALDRNLPAPRPLTTQEAADLLHVSRPHLIQLLEQGEVPYTVVGRRHRRIAHADLLAYKARRDALRRQALDELTAMAEEDGAYIQALEEARRMKP